jgi:hypothetical protein
MALPKQNLPLPFGQGIETKTDKWQVQPGKLLALQNAVFNKGNLLQKRNGFGALTTLDDSTVNTITTFKGGLTALGDSLHGYAPDTDAWYNKGSLAQIDTDVMSLVRSSSSQSQQDAAVSSNGLTCTVWLDSDGSSKYQVIDRETNQVLVNATNLESSAVSARVFVLGRFFVITYMATIAASPHLRFIALPLLDPRSPSSPDDISTVVSSVNAPYDGYVANNSLYLAWDSGLLGGAVRVGYLDSTLLVRTPQDITGYDASHIGVTADTSTPTPTVWVMFKDAATDVLYAAARSSTLVEVLAETSLGTYVDLNQVTGVAADGTLTVLYQTENEYSYAAIRSDFISKITCTQAGVVGSASVVLRSVALASKPFIINDRIYVMSVYGGALQPTYFLIDSDGVILAKLAYSNAGGYPASQILPGANVQDTEVSIAYLYKATLTPVNKTQGVAAVNGIYAQTGINLVTWDISANPSQTVEIGNNLHMTGGYLWMYDGVKPVEHGFHVWPEDVETTVSGTGGLMTAQQYYYSVTYEWTDAQGNLHRSAPSIPVGALTAAATSSVLLDIPTLRLTAKTGNNVVRIVIYRWSTAQQIYYQITSITSPGLNDPTVDSVQYVDTQADSAILGNQILYTTGGVVENIAAPACKAITLFKSRLVLIPAENPNELWFSKQVIQNTPVEMSDLFTQFIAPTVGAQGSTGEAEVAFPMDDKLIIFKRDALYYMTGTGPDNTGNQNDFSEPVFITGAVGTDNSKSLVMTPMGIMFQSDKGIWILKRDLSTEYIGAPVEAYNDATVLSAIAVPGTNQIRFTLDSGVTLMYDYYFGQWGTFSNIPAISSTLYQGLHTYVNSQGALYQETPGQYLDGSSPVLMSFTTAWLNLAGLQGLERAYFFYLLGEYLSPHKLNVEIAYDYNNSTQQSVLITPDNYNSPYGSASGPYGSLSPYGGTSSVEDWRIFFDQQKVQAFRIKITEVFDASIGVAAGAGFTLSGLNMVVGIKKGYRTQSASRSAG